MAYIPDWTFKDLTSENMRVIVTQMATHGLKRAVEQVTLRMLHIGVKHGKALARETIVNTFIRNGQPEIAEIVRKLHL